MRRARLAVLLALLMAGAVVAVALAFDGGDDPAPPPPSRDAATGEWRPLAPAGLERTEVAAARIGRSIYVVGGFEKRSGLTTSALERYDIRANRWRRLRSMPVGLNHPTAAAYRGRLYVHGGYRRGLGNATARLFVYNPKSDRWARLARSARPRAAHGLAVIGRRLYAFGGRNGDGELRSMEVYDFRRRRWSDGPPMNGPPRDHLAGVAAGGFIYALAGRDTSDGPGNYNTAERYDPERRRWQRLPPMRKARGGIASARLSGGRVIVFGGEEPAGTISEVEIYEPRQRRWRALPDMRTPRHGLGGASLNDRVYAIEGGPRPAFHFSNALEFLDVR